MTNTNQDIRWKQRFENFKKSFSLLTRYKDFDKNSELERAGIIQIYEMTFELSWKLLKDYLESQGFVVNSPREALKQAYQSSIIENGEIWLEALGSRNLLTHTYDEKTAIEESEKIVFKFYPEIVKLKQFFEGIQDG